MRIQAGRRPDKISSRLLLGKKLLGALKFSRIKTVRMKMKMKMRMKMKMTMKAGSWKFFLQPILLGRLPLLA